MSDQRTRETRSPPKDKQYSLERDGRDAYGENNKSRRKAIPLFKAQSNRRGRHAARVAVTAIDGDEAVTALLDLAEADAKALRPAKKKSPDLPLSEFIARQRKKRARKAVRPEAD